MGLESRRATPDDPFAPAEPVRPPVRPGATERLLASLEWFGVARLVAAAVSVLVVAGGCWWLLRTPAQPVERSLPYAAGASSSSLPASRRPSGDAAAASSAPTAAPAAPPTTAGRIVVQVAGAVVHPGVYTLPAGARVHELIAAAGGPAPQADAGALNLAAVLADGQRVQVPRIGEPLPPGGGGAVPAGGAAGSVAVSPVRPLDLNRATATELDALPGVGPATAQAIVQYRDEHGPFGAVDDLLQVRGIGPAKLDAIRSLVTT